MPALSNTADVTCFETFEEIRLLDDFREANPLNVGLMPPSWATTTCRSEFTAALRRQMASCAIMNTARVGWSGKSTAP